MATLAGQSPSLAGTTPTYNACSGGGDKVRADGQTSVIIRNGSGGSITVTAVTPATVKGLAVADATVAIPAGAERWVGPFDRDAFGDAQGLVALTYSGVTSLTMAVIRH